MSNPFETLPWPALAPPIYPQYIVKAGWQRRQLLKLLCKPFSTINRKVVVKPGSLSSQVVSQTYAVGNFTIIWTADPANSMGLEVRHRSNPDKTLWASIPGRSFVEGAALKLRILEERGSVEIDELFDAIYSNQTVDKIEQKGDLLLLSGQLQRDKNAGQNTIRPSYSLSFYPSSITDKAIAFKVQITDGANSISQARLLFQTNADEHFYGFGEQFSRVDCKGYEIPVVAEEGGIGRGDAGPRTLRLLGVTGEQFSSYAPSPQFMTNTGRGLFLTNSEPSIFDLRDDTFVSIRVEVNELEGYILAGETPLEGIELLTRFVGRMPVLPDWVHQGAIIGMQGGTQRVREVWQELQKHDTPLAGFWLQDWVGQRKTAIGKQLWWNWTLDESRYPQWPQLVDDLAAADIALGAYINPFLVELPKKEKKKRPKRRDLYREAATRGFLVRDHEGDVYPVKNTDFSAGLVDLSNPEMRQWLKQVIADEMLAIGCKFWMADFAEAAQFDGGFTSGRNGLDYHNDYPVDWAELNREAIANHDNAADCWFFTRAGFLKSPGSTTAMWLGDQNVTWGENDGLPSALDGLLSSGFSGFSVSHSDIGGYTSISNIILRLIGRGFVRSRELLYRWMEMNAFTAIFRTHEGNEPDQNVQFYQDDDTYQTFARWAKVYAVLADYRKVLIQEAASKGYPVVRHPILHYPDDRYLYRLEEKERSFMLGSEFWISPVLKPGLTEKVVYLPLGDWVHLWTGQAFSHVSCGAKVTVAAPLGQPPVFYRKNSPYGDALKSDLQQLGILE